MTRKSVMLYSAMKEETMSNKPAIPYRTSSLTVFWIKATMLWTHIPRRIVASLAVVALFALTAGCNLPSGHTFIVTHGGDDPDTNPGDGKCEIASGLGCSLRAAIEEANALSGADKIHFQLSPEPTIHTDGGFPTITEDLAIDGRTQSEYANQPVMNLDLLYCPAGPCNLFTIGSGVSLKVWGFRISIGQGIYAFFNEGDLWFEDMRITAPVFSRGLGGSAKLTVVSSELGWSNFKPLIEAENSAVQISSSTLHYNNTQDPAVEAGGIVLRGGTATITETEIKKNTGWKSGGIYIDGAEVHLSQTSVSENTGQDAGGIYVESDSELWVDHSWIDGNTAAIISDGDKFGGGIYSEGKVHMSLTAVEGNSGAGIHSRGVGANAVLDLANSDILHNSLAGIHATQSEVDITDTQILSNDNGGIFLAQGSLAVTNSSVVNNENNGGIHVEAASVLINKATISGNSASDTGGGVSLYATLGTVGIVNSTISGNQASNSGGGIAEVGGIVELKNVTVTLNSSGRGAGLYNGAGAIKATNTILADNNGGNCEGTITSLGHNLDNRTTCGFAGPGDISNLNALLGPLQNNGGSTKTHALPNNSPALETGDDAACEAVDQRGISRPQGLHCDMGAFETENPVTATPPSITNTPRRSPTPTITPTRTAIGFLFDPVEYSDNPVFHDGKTCTVKQVTIRVKVSPAELVKSVGLFYRLETKTGDRFGDWGGGLAMIPEGGGWHRMTLNVDDIPDIRNWREDAILAIQFVANGDADLILARSPVHRELVLTLCMR
jgi:CSLREA domain-containing protein